MNGLNVQNIGDDPPDDAVSMGALELLHMHLHMVEGTCTKKELQNEVKTKPKKTYSYLGLR